MIEECGWAIVERRLGRRIYKVRVVCEIYEEGRVFRGWDEMSCEFVGPAIPLQRSVVKEWCKSETVEIFEAEVDTWTSRR